MPQIEDRFEFEPNHDAKNSWLGTRKESKNFGVVTLNGFYQTSNVITDQSWFIGAIIMEFVGIGVLATFGFMRGEDWALIAIVGSILALFFDVLFAVFLHAGEGKRVFARNQKALATSTQQKIGLTYRTEKPWFQTFIWTAMIWFMAFLKAGTIWALGPAWMSPILYVCLALMYLVIAYIHTHHTGWFAIEWKTGRLFRKQHRRWPVDVSLNARALDSAFTCNDQLRIPVAQAGQQHRISHGSHYIEWINPGTTTPPYEYTLHTLGILEDDDIVVFLNQQGPQQIHAIATTCLHHQIFKIHQ
jgi:hypothetical protein